MRGATVAAPAVLGEHLVPYEEFARLHELPRLLAEFADVVFPLARKGPHTVRTIPGRPARVAFTDYASAGNTWMQDSSYRVWLPLELDAFAK